MNDHRKWARRSRAIAATLFVLLTITLTVHARSPRVTVSARAVQPMSFEAFVDGRDVREPYALTSVTLLIRCRTPAGDYHTAWITFHDRMLAGGQLYRKTLSLPQVCAAWDRLEDANVALVGGMADGPSADVRVGQGDIAGLPVSLTPLPAPVQIAPPNGAVFHHFPRRTHLVWEPVRGAAYYVLQIQLGYQGQWSPYKTETNLRELSYAFDFVGAQPGRWMVWAIGPDGQGGIASPWWQFRYTR